MLVIINIIGCANIQRPLGGPRDRTPPKLLLATPVNETRNFNAKQIRMDFDEYFKLVNQFQEITVSPAMEKTPEFKVRQKSLYINFKDTLQKNTTYVINFGKAVADVNEGNVIKNFVYVFSTGPHIDSLTLSGTVVNSLTQEKEKDVTVMLVPIKQDTIWGKHKPSIFTSTDSSGNFSMSYLHDGRYRIYALKEQSANRIYDNESEQVGFLKNDIVLDKDTSGVQLSLFQQDPDRFRILAKRFDADGKILLAFNKKLAEPGITINYPKGSNDQKYVDFSKTRDTALIYLRNMDFDSVSVAITDHGKPIDTTYLRKGRKEAFKRDISIGANISNMGRLKPNTDLQLTLNSPIESFDRSRVLLLEDSVDVSNFTLQKDSLKQTKFILKYRWKQDKRYELSFNEGTFVNIYGDHNKRIVKKFTVDKIENYGTLTLKMTVPDTSKNYVVELLNDKKEVLRSDAIKKNTSLVYKDYPTGRLFVRVTYDTNGNGKWDTGNIKAKRYPENIWVSPTVITLRPNWEMDQDVAIPPEVFIP
ncbi:Ig-like domain-containing protein [Mucilaginibacter yixingensis]|uniref:Ig-like domain-containing protein n=1 Tax=Mucilaginibacter yixingensis TaxID=1295612 RepID=UPI0014737AE7|nr:Ig-like domain-containing protein [Mucilaginibacter yixingensis]